MKHYLLLYIATLLIMVALDMFWIGGVAKDFYRARISNLEFHATPAILFYLMYAAGIVYFVNSPSDTTAQTTLIKGALFGLFAYATYDLTNLATLKGWQLDLAAVDIAWGAFATSMAGTGGLMAARFLERSVFS